MARFATAVLVLVSVAQLAAAYPVFFYRQNKPCLAQPDRGYKGHAAPVNDPTIKFEVRDSAGKPVTSACPGAAYSLKLSFAEPRFALVTADGANFTGSDAECPGRLAVDRSASPPVGGYSPSAEQIVNMTVLCTAAGPMSIKVTSAAGGKSGYKASSTTLAVDAACADKACAAAAAKPAAAKAAAAKPAAAKAPAPAPKAAAPVAKAAAPAKPAAGAAKAAAAAPKAPVAAKP